MKTSTPRTGQIRRILSLVLVASTLALAGCATEPDVAPTGSTTTVEVRMIDSRYVPDTIEVPLGDRLIIELVNDDPDIHDLELENGVATSRFGMGQSETLDAGVIAGDLDGWCTVPPHREHGMVLTVVAT